MSQTVEFKYAIGQEVGHIANAKSRGTVLALGARGAAPHLTYNVCWDTNTANWCDELELKAPPEKKETGPIGYPVD